MAKYNSLGELFTAIANAIRSKTGGADPVVAEDFPTAIKGIEAGGGSGSADFEITDASYLFYKGARMNDMDNLLPLLSSSCKSYRYMFSGNTSLVTVPEFNMAEEYYPVPGSSMTSPPSCYNMFENCSALTTIPQSVLKKLISGDQAFVNCTSLIEVPSFTCSLCGMQAMFYGCTSLVTVHNQPTSEVVQFTNAFNGCTKLETIAGLDLTSATLCPNIVNNCKALTNLTLYNIRVDIQIGSGTTWGHLLTVDSLVHTIQELCTVTSTQTLTMGSANLEKIAGLYCKIIDDANEKKTMELCESTDEGAMTLADYAAEKGWTFA